MSVERFITELQQRDLLTERQLAKLRDAAIERQMSPKALAKFLVQKEYLTQKQATDVLQAVLLRERSNACDAHDAIDRRQRSRTGAGGKQCGQRLVHDEARQAECGFYRLQGVTSQARQAPPLVGLLLRL